jgi:hypothetical protein
LTTQTEPPQGQPANLNVEQMKRGITRLRRRIAELEAFDPRSVQRRWAPEVKACAVEETSLCVNAGINAIEARSG